MQRRVLIPVLGAATVAILGGVGAYTYFFSGLRTSPAPLALSSPAPSAPATASASTSTPAVYAGSWQIGSGSTAGYRVKEQFVGQTSSHEAVARTTAVTGQLSIVQSSGTYQLTAGTITVQLGSLASVDQVAGYNVTNRDRLVLGALGLSQFPTAVFQAQAVAIPPGAESGQAVAIPPGSESGQAVAIPPGAESGQAVTVAVPGLLTIHGVTRAVTATVQLQVSGNAAQAAGNVAINMNDYGVSPPRAPFTTVETAATIEFQVNLTKAA